MVPNVIWQWQEKTRILESDVVLVDDAASPVRLLVVHTITGLYFGRLYMLIAMSFHAG